jgi:hypothetical protein
MCLSTGEDKTSSTAYLRGGKLTVAAVYHEPSSVNGSLLYLAIL